MPNTVTNFSFGEYANCLCHNDTVCGQLIGYRRSERYRAAHNVEIALGSPIHQ